MCLDIDPDSLIHKHINQKINNLYENNGDGTDWNPLIGETYEDGEICEIHRSKHNLTMLPSFHISLGAPHPADPVDKEPWSTCFSPNLEAIVGNIVLADICISEKNGKKSAWIPLNPDIINKVLPHHIDTSDFEYWLCRYDNKYTAENPVKIMHISLANLTGKPRDSIARPEDCIIDTITA